MAAVDLDLDDTSRCPIGHRCEACGDAVPGLTARTATTALGVLCLTMCPRCADAGVTAPVSVSTAARLVLQHCAHLGITADKMAAVLAGRDGDR